MIPTPEPLSKHIRVFYLLFSFPHEELHFSPKPPEVFPHISFSPGKNEELSTIKHVLNISINII